MDFPNPVRDIEDMLERTIYGPRRQLQKTIDAITDPFASVRRWIAERDSARDAHLTGIVLPTKRERDERIRVLEEEAAELRDDPPPAPRKDDPDAPKEYTGQYL